MANEAFYGYLFVHFTSDDGEDGEQVYFSISQDGFHYNDLNGGKPVLRTDIGEKGARDPFIIRSPWEKKYYLIATDLRIASGKGWEIAQYEGSRDLLVWESADLVNWEGPVARTVGIEGAGCVWAPEAIYDEEKDSIMVFWASMTAVADEAPKQRIYRTYTKDFKNFTPAEIYIERDNHVIDTTIIKTTDGYYRYSKDETTKVIRVDFGKNVEPESFTQVASETLDGIYGVEGPEIYKLNGEEKWCLIVDRYASHEGYLPLVTEDLASGKFEIMEDTAFDFGVTLKRHGGILNLTKEEYARLAQMK